MNRQDDTGPNLRRYTRRPEQRDDAAAEASEEEAAPEGEENAFVELLWVEDDEERQTFSTELRRARIEFTYTERAICVRRADIKRAVEVLEQKNLVQARHIFMRRGTPGGDRQRARSEAEPGRRIGRFSIDRVFLGIYVVGLALLFFFSAIGMGAIAGAIGIILAVALFAGIGYLIWRAFVRYTSFM